MVVGISVISSAASTGTQGGCPFQLASPTSVATAIRKMIVMPASRMSSAISFGVFCRDAPSTSAIMRSRKVEPGAAVMRTTSQSETTSVPPVTALRSPPLSRMTGADFAGHGGLVHAGDALDRPRRRRGSGRRPRPAPRRPPAGRSRRAAATGCGRRGGPGAWPASSVRARRRLSACARPRPSATASAKVAKSTVSQSQAAMPAWKPQALAGHAPARMARTVTSTATTSVTKITGLRTKLPRVELAQRVERGARQDGAVGGRGAARRAPRCALAHQRGDVGHGRGPQKVLPASMREMLRQRAEGEGGQELQPAQDQDHARQQPGEERRVRREGAGALRQP